VSFIGSSAVVSHGFDDSFLYRLCSKLPDRPDFGLASTQ
jgi:hypothetical protein